MSDFVMTIDDDEMEQDQTPQNRKEDESSDENDSDEDEAGAGFSFQFDVRLVLFGTIMRGFLVLVSPGSPFFDSARDSLLCA